MKKPFRNYNFEFNKNQTKILSAFCKQVLKQVSGNQNYFQEEKAFTSILTKIDAGETPIKLTKDEFFKMKNQLSENIKYLTKEKDKSWFFKKWMMKSMLIQYSSIYDEHFSN